MKLLRMLLWQVLKKLLVMTLWQVLMKLLRQAQIKQLRMPPQQALKKCLLFLLRNHQTVFCLQNAKVYIIRVAWYNLFKKNVFAQHIVIGEA